jgi:hypothetical protein
VGGHKRYELHRVGQLEWCEGNVRNAKHRSTNVCNQLHADLHRQRRHGRADDECCCVGSRANVDAQRIT